LQEVEVPPAVESAEPEPRPAPVAAESHRDLLFEEDNLDVPAFLRKRN
jgi:hypothetical protein